MQLQPGQMETMREDTTAAFYRRAMDHLQRRHPALSAEWGDAQVQRMLQRSVERCAALEECSEKCVVLLVDLSLTHRRDVFATDPWAAEILSSPYISAAEKAKRLQSYL